MKLGIHISAYIEQKLILLMEIVLEAALYNLIV